MSRLTFEFQWQSPEGAKGDELRATWAQLALHIDGRPVTRVEDHVGHGVRSGIFIPLYPVAEWIARNWWSLLHEVPLPKSKRSIHYARRHNLKFAAEGFALPDLLIQPEGSQVILEWKPLERPACGVTFLDAGRIVLCRSDVEEALAKFNDTVVKRLSDQGVPETFLSEEWKAISEADMEELDFCKAVGRLGEDPYARHIESGEATLLELADVFPSETVEEFLAAVDWPDVKKSGQQLKQFADSAATVHLDLQPMLEFRENTRQQQSSFLSGGAPWKQGYEWAIFLREKLELSPNDALPPEDQLGKLFGVKPDEWKKAISGNLLGCDFISAAATPTSDNFPLFAMSSHYDVNRVFALCRGIFEYFVSNSNVTGLATSAYSERQKRNRAFAAEFIAPKLGIQERLAADSIVSEEEVAGIAEYFKTSEYVIRNQIQNLHIATIQEASYA